MAKLALAFLGSFRVTFDGRAITRFGTDKTRALLAYLALESKSAHRRETLAAMLWPDQVDEAARHSLRQGLLRLRGAFSHCTPFLHVTPETLAFDRASDYSLDVDEFAAQMQACHAHPHAALSACAACSARVQRAVELYRGELLTDLFIGESTRFEEWVLVRREVLHRQLLDALDALTAYHLARYDFAGARAYAARQIELEPWHEQAHRTLMDAFAREGQRGAALAQYETCRKILAREFNTAPAEETTELYDQIRGGARMPRLCPAPNVDTLTALAQYYGAQGDLARAYVYQAQVLARHNASGDKWARASAHQQIGLFLQAQNKWRAARTHFRAALALSKEIGDRNGQSAALEALAQLRARQGDLNGAHTDFRRALNLAETAHNPAACARVLTQLGALAQAQRKFKAARAYWARALARQKRLGNRAAITDLQARVRAGDAAN